MHQSMQRMGHILLLEKKNLLMAIYVDFVSIERT
jgi:hypothetical protein